ncbi:MAG TPA: sensor domain-containing diguanylate cyclase, partial [Candidatus Omnitrophota bacterium]|nr:sensor domain-containing diguanylate cyclase [Candidatus Omnitrophota bacterium]
LSHHIKDNMDELKIYGERTKDINAKINKQVVALSGVLQIGNLISAKTELKDVFETVVSRLGQVTGSSCSFILLKEDSKFEIAAHFGLKDSFFLAAGSPSGEFIFNSFISSGRAVIIDEKDRMREKENLLKLLEAKVAIVEPIFAHGEPRGLLGIARTEGEHYSQDDAELMDVYIKQLNIAIENDFLSRKVQDLEIKDTLTGLYNRRYIIDRLDEEILRAISHQRPCALMVLKIRNIKDLFDSLGEAAVEDVLKNVSNVIKDSFGELDRAGRINYDEFGIILAERNKKQAQELAENIKNKIVSGITGVNRLKKQDVSVCVVENPVDGEDSKSLLEKAEKNVSL